MPARRPLIAGNWKMNGLRADGIALARAIVEKVGGGSVACDLLVCPPATLIAPVADVVQAGPVALGGQDCHTAKSGAHTGDVSAWMLADLGCRYVIVGHSERRADHGETNAVVKAKAEAALAAGLIPIVCVGETEAERDAGRTLAVVGGQVRESLPDGASAENTVIAYEPVWAIGTGRTPTTAEVADVHADIRRQVAQKLGEKTAAGMRVLYGGSVKPSNAKELLAIEDVDGALVGGASLKADDFWAVAQSCP